MVPDVMITATRFKRSYCLMNCNEHELEKFENTHELDTAVTVKWIKI